MKLERKGLIINGAERFVLYDSEKDSIAIVLRRLGLTGVKIGCGIGVCGACTIILNGEVVRCCNRKVAKIEEYSEITTIEGIGTPTHLHPLQQAWITYGGVQCGFCSPGFIVSAYGLLKRNSDPTREEVREWFRKNNNICRCTGYKPLVDSVMAAAAVLQDKKTMADITYDKLNEKEIYGSRHPRPAALAKVCGLADFGDDIKLKMPENVVHLAPVISEVLHAKIDYIDISEAEKMPGVYKILLAKDVPPPNNLASPPIIKRIKGDGITDFPVIAGDIINRRGDCVALVAADSEQHARDAAKKVKVNLAKLPAYRTFLEAVMPNAIQLHRGVPNFYMEQPLYKGEDIDKVFDVADYVVGGSFHSQHEPHLPIEPDVVQGYYDSDGLLTIQCKSHELMGNVTSLANALGLKEDQLRFIMNPAGGAFGYTTTANTFALVAVAVLILKMPCTMTLTYAEFNHMTGKRSASFANGRLAINEKGKIMGAEYDIALDHGSYAVAASIIFQNLVSVGFHGYNIPNIRALARGGASNNAFNTAYRGFGAPQIYTTTEALIDMAADEIGMDPWAFRYLNVAKPGDLTINSRPYLDYPYQDLLEKIKPIYDGYKADAATAKKEDRYVGVGISMGGFLATIGLFDKSEVALELNSDGTITHFNTWEDVGQGGDIGALTHAVKALAPMGVKATQIRLVMNDTKKCPDSGVAAASRSHYMNGNSTIDAADKLMNAMRKPDGTWRTYDEMVAEGIPTKYLGHYDQFDLDLDPCLDPNTGEGERNAAFMYVVNACLVEVDIKTGRTQVLKYIAVSDIGTIGNLLSVEGQGYGGLSHSIGFALSEDYKPEDRYSNMAACGIPTIDMIPDEIELRFVENYRERGPHGSSGCAENFQCSGHMAVINAIKDATGVRIYELPATPDKVKAAWEAKQRGEEFKPEKYFLGNSLDDELAFIKDNPL